MQEAELRERTRALLKEVNPDDESVSMADFRGAQFDHGLAWVHFPEGHGGLGLNAKLQAIVYDELQRIARKQLKQRFDKGSPSGEAPVQIILIGKWAPGDILQHRSHSRLAGDSRRRLQQRVDDRGTGRVSHNCALCENAGLH